MIIIYFFLTFFLSIWIKTFSSFSNIFEFDLLWFSVSYPEIEFCSESKFFFFSYSLSSFFNRNFKNNALSNLILLLSHSLSKLLFNFLFDLFILLSFSLLFLLILLPKKLSNLLSNRKEIIFFSFFLFILFSDKYSLW